MSLLGFSQGSPFIPYLITLLDGIRDDDAMHTQLFTEDASILTSTSTKFITINSCSSFSFFLVLLLIITFAKLSEAACKGPGTYDHWIFFTTPLIAPNGSATDFASALPGTRWPYAGNFYDAPDATAAKALGYDTDLCTYLSADAPQMWQCTGTYIDSFG